MMEEDGVECSRELEKLCYENCEIYFEKKYKEKCEDAFISKMNCLSSIVSVVAIVIGSVLLTLFLYGRIPIEIKVEETLEYSTSSYIYPCYTDYVQFHKNRFPYRHVTKKSFAPLITFIICVSCVLATAIICVAVLAGNAYKCGLAREKLCALKCVCDKVQPCLTDENTKASQIYDGAQTEYYPKNKAVADVFKAYASAIAEL